MEWFNSYYRRSESDSCPLECYKEVFNKRFCIFVNETRSKDDDPYPPKTMESLSWNSSFSEDGKSKPR